MIWEAVDNWMTDAPLIVLGLIVLGGVGLAVVAGVALRKLSLRRDRGQGSAPGEGIEGIIASATLGLMALLMGFTFSIVLNRFEDRRALVLEEANAIGTVYLRAQLLEQPHRDRISRLLTDYTDVRIELAQSVRGKNAALVAENDRLLTSLWVATMAAYPTIKDPGLSGRFLECMNGMIDLDTSRKMARVVHVPSEVFFTLFVFLLATGGILGYLLTGRRGRGVLSFMVVLLTLVLIMILDADRPNDGGIREDQTPMKVLKASLEGMPPKAYDEQLSELARTASVHAASALSPDVKPAAP